MAADGYAAQFVKHYQTGWHVTEENIAGSFSELVKINFRLPDTKLDVKNLSFDLVTRKFLKAAYQLEPETVNENQLTNI